MWGSVWDLSYSGVCFRNLYDLVFGTWIVRIEMLIGGFFFWWVCSVFPYIFWLFLIWILFCQVLIWHQQLAFIVICLQYLYPYFYSDVISILYVNVSFLSTAGEWILFSHLIYYSVSFYSVIETIYIASYQWALLCDSFYWLFLHWSQGICFGERL